MRVRFVVIITLLAFSLTFSGILSQVESQVSSPRQQMESGIDASDVICKSGYVLMIRTSNGAAACVSPSSGTTLESRGWGVVESEPFTGTESSNQEIELEENLPIEHSDNDEGEVIEVEIDDGVGTGDRP